MSNSPVPSATLIPVVLSKKFSKNDITEHFKAILMLRCRERQTFER
jgi:hypothetical protein